VVAALAAGALVCGMTPARTAAQAVQGWTVTVAIVPSQTTVDDLSRTGDLSLGVMSAGIGRVPSEQTFLDVSQGNRVDDVLYDRRLPGLYPFAREVPEWPDVVARAESAPADLVPGLLARQLNSAGIPAYARQPMSAAALTAADRRGVVSPLPPGGCAHLCLAVVNASLAQLPVLARGLRGDDLLIAIASPPPASDRALPIGIAGRGFEGGLTSDSTRTDGYVLSTDVAPTILRRFGLPIPNEMDGDPIRSEGSTDPASVTELAVRMAAIPDRREPILVACILAWLLVAFAVNRLVFGLRRVAMAWLALCFAYMPLTLLAGAWLEPSALVEGLLVGLGSALLAALTVRFAWGWRGLAIACAITVIAYAIDVIAGSGLTRLSLLGPNPVFGARFYGIGNELEALFAVMIPVGVGAGLSAWRTARKPVNEKVAALAFLMAGLVFAVIFGVGRFGADVGAAIVLPVGAAVAAVTLRSRGLVEFPGNTPGKSTRLTRPQVLGALIGAPFVALVFLVLTDLVSGGNSHLTRSVVNAGGGSNLADVAQRRLELSAHDFAQAAGNPLFWIVVVGIGVGISRWRRIDAWLRPAPIARAGLIGACAAVAVGVLANDSGATFLVLGGLALGAFLAFAWSQAGEISSSPRNAGVSGG
jgi:hypothetical protein